MNKNKDNDEIEIAKDDKSVSNKTNKSANDDIERTSLINKKLKLVGEIGSETTGRRHYNLRNSSSQIVHVKTNRANIFSNNLHFNFIELMIIILTHAIPSAFFILYFHC